MLKRAEDILDNKEANDARIAAQDAKLAADAIEFANSMNFSFEEGFLKKIFARLQEKVLESFERKPQDDIAEDLFLFWNMPKGSSVEDKCGIAFTAQLTELHNYSFNLRNEPWGGRNEWFPSCSPKYLEVLVRMRDIWFEKMRVLCETIEKEYQEFDDSIPFRICEIRIPALNDKMELYQLVPQIYMRFDFSQVMARKRQKTE